MSLSAKRLIIVGNGDLSRDLSAEIDAAQFVLRFNEPKAGMSGTRTDLLMMINSSKQMQKWLQESDFVHSPFFVAAREIMLVHHPLIIRKYCVQPNVLSRLKGRRTDWTWAAINILGSAGKEIRIMPPQDYIDGCRELGIPEDKMHEVFPSTGFLGIRYILKNFSKNDWDIKLCGFGWEGWKRHAWADERRWVSGKIEEGLLSILD
ncbi:glycosyltransferase family 29 protein [Phyllobacterium leguminum]|uniref:Glycosyl transferase family 29 (Putative sialyltransferase) n=1 Tax=Phyllobacterium leguminum TaxID=314237 RepID=A0A318TDJ8_9HYPH|nr:glycosyltransferase family 29 protein [Phyllobacterium leguminum]PYE86388.1 glycosyl transferase family 29 (putative sialyltransferase) [Phyllobacterium leguminum]